jgi:hypothetical protein
MHDDAIRYRAWHAERIRGLDRTIYLGPEHLARIDTSLLPPDLELTPVGEGLRIVIPAARRRLDFGPVEQALANLLPSAPAAAEWLRARGLT